MYYIDKTEILEKGITVFPSLFIEGAAACGKTTVVNMFLKAHPEAHSGVFFMDKEVEEFQTFKERLDTYLKNDKETYVVFENIQADLPAIFLKKIVEFIGAMQTGTAVFLMSREKPARELLELLWKGKMGMIFPQNLFFTAADVSKYFSQRNSSLRADDVFRVTGGWPGCVSMIARLSEQLGAKHQDAKDAKAICQRYEVKEYVEQEILSSLSKDEEELLRRADLCPWLNAELCEEVWGVSLPEAILKDLERKGLLVYNETKKRWKIMPLFQGNKKREILPNVRRRLGKWYEEHGDIEEALYCMDDPNCELDYQECMIRHFDVVPFIGLLGKEVLQMKGNTPQLCYLRGMYHYLTQDFAGLRREIAKVEKQEGKLADEVYLNLTFVDFQIPTNDWLALLEEKGRQWAPIRLYHFTENASVFSTGWRELGDMFVGSTIEVNRRRQTIKEIVGEKEWIGMRLAYVDFILETRQRDVLKGELWGKVLRVVNDEADKFNWRYKVVCLYLLSNLYITTSDVEVGEQVKKLTESLRGEERDMCQKYLYAVDRLQSLWQSREDRATRWLQKISDDTYIEVTEENYYMLFLRLKGFMLVNQYAYAKRIIDKLLPYLKIYHRTRLIAEVLFQQAIVEWESGKKGAALRSVIESFVYTGELRYVTFYVTYGKHGKEVLDAYIDWQRKMEPQKWSRKKTYNYGNVLRMPTEDYLETLLRQAKRRMKQYPEGTEPVVVEKLTMMETVILQDINKGLSNVEICEELNLKLPTVKTHISNIYRKLDVNNRVQAILKGKELGVIK